MARKILLRGDTLPLIRRLWWDWMRPHAKTLALVLLLVILVSGATGLYPVLIKAAFDAFDAKDAQAIALAPLFVIAVTSVKGFSLLALTILTNKVVTRIEADMQTALYGHMIEADLAQIGRESPAALTQRFTTDFAFIREALTRLSTVFLREITTIIALIAAMLWIDPVLTIVAAVIAPFFAYPVNKIGRKLRRVAISTQEQSGSMASLITESLAGTRIAKTYGLERYLKAKAAKTFDDVRALKMKAANARGRMDPILETGGGLAVAIVLILIGHRILSGGSTVGDFTGFVTALVMAAQPIRALGNLNAIVQEAAAALQRTFAIMDEAPRIQDRPEAKPLQLAGGEIRFSNLTFSYDGDAVALDRVNLVAEAGETTALVGRSGSGKSTLLALVPRLYDVNQGAVLIDGQDVRDVTLASLRRDIAVVSQDVILFDDTVRANIAFGRADATDEEIVGGGQGRGGARFHHEAAGRLRHGGRHRRRAPLRRRAPAHLAGSRLPEGRADPAPRRGDQRARFRIGAPRPGRHPPAHEGPHHPRHRPPALDGAQCGEDRGDGERPHRGDGIARGPDRQGRRLCPPASAAARRRWRAQPRDIVVLQLRPIRAA